MKSAKNILSSLLDSIEHTIQVVTDTAVKEFHADDLVHLPHDVHAIIFEMYVDMYTKSACDGHNAIARPPQQIW